MEIKNKKIIIVSLFSLILISTVLFFIPKSSKEASHLISQSNEQITMIKLSNGIPEIIKSVPTTGNWKMKYECDDSDIKLYWNNQEKKLVSKNLKVGKCTITFEEITDGVNILSIYVDNEFVTGLDSTKNYLLTSYACSNNETVSWIDPTKKLSIKGLTKTTTCTLYFKLVNTLKTQILADNTAQSDANIYFGSTSEDTNTNGLYYTANASTYGEDGQTIYYYRGNVRNNWVTFGGYLWRIVRTTSEGGVRLAYAGVSGTILTESSAFIATAVPFNVLYDSNYYVGYTYNENSYTGTQTNSNVKCVVDGWYMGSNVTCGGTTYNFTGLSTRLSNNNSYISNTAVYCNDRSVDTISSSIFFPAYNRLWNDEKPSFACSSINASRYTASTSTGNGYLTNPIAILNADELSYAGLAFNYTAEQYIRDNTYDVQNWWTMSPYQWKWSSASIWRVNVNGVLQRNDANAENGVRPAISLKSSVVVIGGNGSESSPYELSDGSCIN